MTHYDYNAILELAEPLPKKPYKRATIVLAEGDTCIDPGSTKYQYEGPGEIVIIIHPSGWNWDMDTTIRRRRLR